MVDKNHMAASREHKSLGTWVDLSTQLSNPAQASLRLRKTAACSDCAIGERRTLQAQRRLSQDEIRELVDAYRAGSSAEVLAKAFGIHRTTVLADLERSGVERRVNDRRRPNAQLVYWEPWSE